MFDCLGLSVCACLEVKVGVLVFWHLNNRLNAIAAVQEREGDGLPHLLGETVLEILHKHIAKQLLDVALEQNLTITVIPTMYASVQSVLKLSHGVSISGSDRGELFGGRRWEVGFGSHCRAWLV